MVGCACVVMRGWNRQRQEAFLLVFLLILTAFCVQNERNRRENETRGRGLPAVGLGTKLTECEFHHLHHHHPHPHHPLSVPHGPWERRWRQGGVEKKGRVRTENRIGAYKKEIEGQGKQAKVTTGEKKRGRREKGGRSEWGSNPLTLGGSESTEQIQT